MHTRKGDATDSHMHMHKKGCSSRSRYQHTTLRLRGVVCARPRFEQSLLCCSNQGVAEMAVHTKMEFKHAPCTMPVSYTHLTLPTILLV